MSLKAFVFGTLVGDERADGISDAVPAPGGYPGTANCLRIGRLGRLADAQRQA